MITVDRYRCAYCGGCVSVCPEGALTLAEARLLVSSECTSCGHCVAACPMGALSLPGSRAEQALPPNRRSYDLVVVGAGPGGSLAAQTAAEAGLSVLLIEKRQEIGSPVRCAEGVGHELLLPFVEPDPRWISAEVTRAEITAVRAGQAHTLRAAGGQGYVLERRVFDRLLAERAVRAGAEVRVKTAASGLIVEGGAVRGIRLRRGDFLAGAGELEVAARVVIAADGVEAQVGRWAGLDVQLPLADTMVCAQYLLAGIDIDPTCTSYTIDYDTAPGGYAWVFPKGEGKANVGLGVQADLWRGDCAVENAESAERNKDFPASPARPAVHGIGAGTVLGYLTRFIEARPCLAQGHPVTLIPGNVPVALSPARLVMGGLMLVGDAARQVDPLTGGGIVNAMVAGRLAAQVAASAIRAGDTSAAYLSRYEQEWQAALGRKMQRNYRLRGRFAPQERADERFVQMFALAAAGK